MNERGTATAIEMPATVKTSAMAPNILDLRQMKSMSIAPGLGSGRSETVAPLSMM
jgi:hypothetical protein